MQGRLAFCARWGMPILALLALMSCSAGDSTAPHAPGPDQPILNTVPWSDASSWAGGKVPVAGDAVTIPTGKAILLDVSPPALTSLQIDGSLVFDDKDIALTAGWIMVHGTLRIGTSAAPYTKRALITLTASPDGQNVQGMGNKVLGVMSGGTLDIHGEHRTTWTRLGATAASGATQLTLDQTIDWRVGDRLVVASTDFDYTQDEELKITAASGASVTIEQPLAFQHYGQIQSFAGKNVDERAEVGLLTHNITIQGDSVGSAGGYGGHIMVMSGGTARVEGVELYHMGQKSQLARYPMHWHMAGAVDGQYFAFSSVWRSFNRCVTVHGSSNARVEGNVCYDDIGHGYFLEDGAETGNQFLSNLGLGTKAPATGEQILPTDTKPATFWLTNPSNTIRGNAAAGSKGIGFWFSLPASPTGLSQGSTLKPRGMALGEFSDNVAHSNRSVALNIDNGPKLDGTTETAYYDPRAEPGNGDSSPIPAEFKNLVAWKQSGRAVWMRGSNLKLVGPVLADNGIGVTFAASDTRVEDALFVGQTANAPTPFPSGTVVRGYEYYDGIVGADRATFVNYNVSGVVPSSALGFLRSNAFSVSTANYAGALTFVNSNAVYLEDPHPDSDGDKAAVFLDQAGAVTGTPNDYVVANIPFLVAPGCTLKTAWNAQVCPGRYVELHLNSEGAEDIAPVTLTRDDGAAVSLVGIPSDLKQAHMSVRPSRKYTLQFSGAVPLSTRFNIRQSVAGEYVRLTVPYPSASFRVIRDYNTSKPLVAAASLAELDASTGDRYYYDVGAQLLHLKAVTQVGYDSAVLFVEPQ